MRDAFRTMARWVLGLALAYAGVSHWTFARQEFQAQVPSWIPVSADLVILLSGIVEIVLGIALLTGRRHRATAGWLVAAFFVAVFPGNINQYVHHLDAFGLETDRARFIRLFFQPVLVAWALWCTSAWATWRSRNVPS